MTGQELSGILNINKPQGMTSHDVVLRVRRIAGQRKVGHAGTLDPMATGVLLICLGQATRVAEYLTKSDKVYVARIRLGATTDTYDAEGRVTAQAEVDVSRAQVEQELGSLVGSVSQTPPMYSAVKHEGTPLHRLARRGEVVARKARTVLIWALTLTEWAPPELEVEVQCSKGTYVRSLAHELGQRLGCGAHLSGLTRTASGRFRISQALNLDGLERAFARGEGPSLLLPLDAALQDFPAITVDPATERRVSLGQRVQLAGMGTAEEAGQAGPSAAALEAKCRAYTLAGRLLALLQLEADGLWQPHKVFLGQTSDESHPRPG